MYTKNCKGLKKKMELHFLLLLLAFQAKHLIADYYLQFPYMYENKGKKENWIEPLFDHSLIHALSTFLIIFLYMLYAGLPYKVGGGIAVIITFGLSIFDFVTHFITDRWKATRKTDPSQSWFWQSLGIDQMIHHTIGIIIAYCLITL